MILSLVSTTTLKQLRKKQLNLRQVVLLKISVDENSTRHDQALQRHQANGYQAVERDQGYRSKKEFDTAVTAAGSQFHDAILTTRDTVVISTVAVTTNSITESVGVDQTGSFRIMVE